MFYLVQTELPERMPINKSSTCLRLPDDYRQMSATALPDITDAWNRKKISEE